MAAPPPLPEDARDTEQLRLLAILHYVAAGLGFVGLLFVWLHYAAMVTMGAVFESSVKRVAAEVEKEKAAEGLPLEGEAGDLPIPTDEVPRVSADLPVDFFDSMMDFAIYAYLAVAALIVLKITLNTMSARRISRRKGRVFSMVVAGLNCLSLPLGTALGIFTLVVLTRPSVAKSYGTE